MTRILEAPVYRFELLSGLVASAGGLTESLVSLDGGISIVQTKRIVPNTH